MSDLQSKINDRNAEIDRLRDLLKQRDEEIKRLTLNGDNARKEAVRLLSELNEARRVWPFQEPASVELPVDDVPLPMREIRSRIRALIARAWKDHEVSIQRITVKWDHPNIGSILIEMTDYS